MTNFNLMKKVITVTIICILSALFIGGCGKDESEEKAKGDRILVLTHGFGADELFRIEDVSCKLSEYMVYLTNIQKEYEANMGTGIWKKEVDGRTLEDSVKDVALSRISQVKTMNILAASYGLGLDEEEREQALTRANRYFDSLTEEEVKILGIDITTLTTMCQEYMLADKLYESIIADINPEISDDEARKVLVEQIFLRTAEEDEKGNLIHYAQDKKDEALRKAEEIRGRIGEEESFESLSAQYNQAEEMTVSIGRGERDSGFEEAVFGLDKNEISEVLEASEGLYILKCVSTNNQAETEINKIRILEERRKLAFEKEYDTFAEGLVKKMNNKVWENVAMIHDDALTTHSFFKIVSKEADAGEDAENAEGTADAAGAENTTDSADSEAQEKRGKHTVEEPVVDGQDSWKPDISMNGEN